MFTLVARGPQGYRVVRCNAFRYLDLKEGILHSSLKMGRPTISVANFGHPVSKSWLRHLIDVG